MNKNVDTSLGFYLFKTNIHSIKVIHKISPFLDVCISNGKWNFDLEDVDNLLCLRVSNSTKILVENVLTENGYFIEELHYLEHEL